MDECFGDWKPHFKWCDYPALCACIKLSHVFFFFYLKQKKKKFLIANEQCLFFLCISQQIYFIGNLCFGSSVFINKHYLERANFKKSLNIIKHLTLQVSNQMKEPENQKMWKKKILFCIVKQEVDCKSALFKDNSSWYTHFCPSCQQRHWHPFAIVHISKAACKTVLEERVFLCFTEGGFAYYPVQ